MIWCSTAKAIRGPLRAPDLTGGFWWDLVRLPPRLEVVESLNSWMYMDHRALRAADRAIQRGHKNGQGMERDAPASPGCDLGPVRHRGEQLETCHPAALCFRWLTTRPQSDHCAADCPGSSFATSCLPACSSRCPADRSSPQGLHSQTDPRTGNPCQPILLPLSSG